MIETKLTEFRPPIESRSRTTRRNPIVCGRAGERWEATSSDSVESRLSFGRLELEPPESDPAGNFV